jgi:hypothetical protein
MQLRRFGDRCPPTLENCETQTTPASDPTQPARDPLNSVRQLALTQAQAHGAFLLCMPGPYRLCFRPSKSVRRAFCARVEVAVVIGDYDRLAGRRLRGARDGSRTCAYTYTACLRGVAACRVSGAPPS